MSIPTDVVVEGIVINIRKFTDKKFMLMIPYASRKKLSFLHINSFITPEKANDIIGKAKALYHNEDSSVYLEWDNDDFPPILKHRHQLVIVGNYAEILEIIN